MNIVKELEIIRKKVSKLSGICFLDDGLMAYALDGIREDIDELIALIDTKEEDTK